MKYYILKAMSEYLQGCVHTIRLAKRVQNNTILLEFNDRNEIYFDLTKGDSLIYKKEQRLNRSKDYNAPFDTLLQKRFNNSKVDRVELHNDDKIIRFYVRSKSSYKELKTILQLEFTGKYTNIILLDENEIILEALRYIDEYSSVRVIKVGEKLQEIPKQDFVPKIEPIEDIEKLLFELYENKEQKLLQGVKKTKHSQLLKQIKKLDQTINSLPKKEQLESESEVMYEEANLILNHLHEIKPYQTSIEVFDYSGEKREIQLKTEGSPSVYANSLFKKAKRLKQKSINIRIEKENLEQKLEFYQRMSHQVEVAQTIDDIEFLLPKKQKNQTKTKKAEPYESFFFQGYKIMLGVDERSNVYLLQNSRASDFWFHLKDANSAHVIVQTTKKSLPIDVIYKAAEICTMFSTDFPGKYMVDFTQRRNVKVQNRANVLYNPYDSIDVHIKA